MHAANYAYDYSRTHLSETIDYNVIYSSLKLAVLVVLFPLFIHAKFTEHSVDRYCEIYPIDKNFAENEAIVTRFTMYVRKSVILLY